MKIETIFWTLQFHYYQKIRCTARNIFSRLKISSSSSQNDCNLETKYYRYVTKTNRWAKLFWNVIIQSSSGGLLRFTSACPNRKNHREINTKSGDCVPNKWLPLSIYSCNIREKRSQGIFRQGLLPTAGTTEIKNGWGVNYWWKKG